MHKNVNVYPKIIRAHFLIIKWYHVHKNYFVVYLLILERDRTDNNLLLSQESNLNIDKFDNLQLNFIIEKDYKMGHIFQQVFLINNLLCSYPDFDIMPLTIKNQRVNKCLFISDNLVQTMSRNYTITMTSISNQEFMGQPILSVQNTGLNFDQGVPDTKAAT